MANLTSLVSALALAYALAQWMGLRALAFVMFVYLCFSPKNMTFEYYLMSEHYSRVSFVLYAAAVLMVLKSPYSWRTAAFVSAVTAWALLVKPTAIVCIVATLTVYGFFYFRHVEKRPRLRMVATAVTAASVATLFLYMAAFDMRFGRFALTNFSGTNQFSHSGHLIDFESEENADLKARLRPIMERYQREFVAKHDYEPNWLIYGSTTEALRQAFGNISPRSILESYLRDRGVTPDAASMNRLYGELALEGIRSHPMAYAVVCIRSRTRILSPLAILSFIGSIAQVRRISQTTARSPASCAPSSMRNGTSRRRLAAPIRLRPRLISSLPALCFTGRSRHAAPTRAPIRARWNGRASSTRCFRASPG